MQKIDLSANSFTTASGNTYFLYDSLSAAYFAAGQALEAEMSAGTTIENVMQDIDKAYDALNKSKPADAAVILNNMRTEAQRVSEGKPEQILMYCTLFIRKADENTAVWNVTDAQAKIEDWSDIDVGFFLRSFIDFKRIFMRNFYTNTQPSLIQEDASGEDQDASE